MPEHSHRPTGFRSGFCGRHKAGHSADGRADEGAPRKGLCRPQPRERGPGVPSQVWHPTIPVASHRALNELQ